MAPGAVEGAPRLILRAEGAALLAAGCVAYWMGGEPWWIFAVFLLAPDLSLFGYLGGPRVGAATYDAAHTLVAPALLAGLALALDARLLLSLAAIWLAHVGLDRALGYGLKYASDFADTHLGRIGRRVG